MLNLAEAIGFSLKDQVTYNFSFANKYINFRELSELVSNLVSSRYVFEKGSEKFIREQLYGSTLGSHWKRATRSGFWGGYRAIGVFEAGALAACAGVAIGETYDAHVARRIIQGLNGKSITELKACYFGHMAKDPSTDFYHIDVQDGIAGRVRQLLASRGAELQEKILQAQ